MNPPPPFSCTYSPNVSELLMQLGCTIAITTYQAGKLIFISSDGNNSLIQLPRDFNKAMGLAVEGRRIAIATKDEVIVLADAKGLANNYPLKPNTYDALYLPRAVYHVGMVDIHDSGLDNATAEHMAKIPFNSQQYNMIAGVSPDGNTMLVKGVFDSNGEVTKRGYSVIYRTKTGWSTPEDED